MDLKLTDFRYSSPGYGRKVAVVAVGSGGCRIAHQLSKESRLLEHFVYVTCDDHDVANIVQGEKVIINATSKKKSTPYDVRGLAISKIPELRQHIKDSALVFVVCGLGGAVGSGLAPLVAKEAKEKGAVVVAVVVMPPSFDKPRHYFAGGALKYLRSYSSGVIVIDNEELLEDKSMPIIDAYSKVNQKIAIALNKLLGSTEQHEFSIGLNNVVDFVRTNSYSVLCIGEGNEEARGYRRAVMNAASQFERIVDPREASKSLIHIIADKSITMRDLVSSVGGLSGVLGDGTMQIEYGFSANGTTCTSAIIMATGFSSIRFDAYDPVDSALGKNAFNMESDYDTALGIELLLPDYVPA